MSRPCWSALGGASVPEGGAGRIGSAYPMWHTGRGPGGGAGARLAPSRDPWCPSGQRRPAWGGALELCLGTLGRLWCWGRGPGTPSHRRPWSHGAGAGITGGQPSGMEQDPPHQPPAHPGPRGLGSASTPPSFTICTPAPAPGPVMALSQLPGQVAGSALGLGASDEAFPGSRPRPMCVLSGSLGSSLPKPAVGNRSCGVW